MRHLLTVLACGLVPLVHALDSAGWRKQSIYQVMTDRFARTDGSTTAPCSLGEYCGGTWQGLIDHLDYIQGMGFTAVWISPVVKNVEGSTIDGDSYHGYWAQKIDLLNEKFGTADDLANLTTALHDRGMYLMVDVVTNHMGNIGPGASVDYSQYDVFNSQSYYHPFCLIDYNNDTSTKQCWAGDNIVSLPDLRTEDSDVRTKWNSWIKDLVSKYGIDGIRIDSCISVELDFFDGFVSSSGVYAVCEAFNGDPNVLCPYQEHMPGALNYATYFWIKRAFQTTTSTMAELANGVTWMQSTCKDTSLLGSFIENHDNPRFPSLTSDTALNKNAIAYAMMADGIPIIYQGQEQYYSGAGTPANREPIWPSKYSTTSDVYRFIASVNAIRNWAVFKDTSYASYKTKVAQATDHVIALRKGSDGIQIVSVLSNFGASSGSQTLSLSGHGYAADTSVTDILTCETATVDSSGNITVTILAGAPQIYYPTSQLSGSNLCS